MSDRGDLPAARQEFRRALEVLGFVIRGEPDSQDIKSSVRDAHFGVGTTHAAQRNYSEAIHEFDLASRFDSGDQATRIWKSKAQCLYAIFAASLH